MIRKLGVAQFLVAWVGLTFQTAQRQIWQSLLDSTGNSSIRASSYLPSRVQKQAPSPPTGRAFRSWVGTPTCLGSNQGFQIRFDTQRISETYVEFWLMIRQPSNLFGDPVAAQQQG